MKSPQFSDPQLGDLKRSRGRWRGRVAPENVVPLSIEGGRTGPDAALLPHARAAAAEIAAARPAIAQALFEHYAAYRDGGESGDADWESLPKIAEPAGVWQHVQCQFADYAFQNGAPVLEIGYRVAWDDDHMLGARIGNGRLLELNGSVVAP